MVSDRTNMKTKTKYLLVLSLASACLWLWWAFNIVYEGIIDYGEPHVTLIGVILCYFLAFFPSIIFFIISGYPPKFKVVQRLLIFIFGFTFLYILSVIIAYYSANAFSNKVSQKCNSLYLEELAEIKNSLRLTQMPPDLTLLHSNGDILFKYQTRDSDLGSIFKYNKQGYYQVMSKNIVDMRYSLDNKKSVTVYENGPLLITTDKTAYEISTQDINWGHAKYYYYFSESSEFFVFGIWGNDSSLRYGDKECSGYINDSQPSLYALLNLDNGLIKYYESDEFHPSIALEYWPYSYSAIDKEILMTSMYNYFDATDKGRFFSDSHYYNIRHLGIDELEKLLLRVGDERILGNNDVMPALYCGADGEEVVFIVIPECPENDLDCELNSDMDSILYIGLLNDDKPFIKIPGKWAMELNSINKYLINSSKKDF